MRARFSIVSRFFHPCGKLSIDEFPSHTVHLGKILDKEKLIDEALLTVMKSPKSYTGENMAEISCHGGVYILRKTLEMCLENGARQAEPGEFTKRAFLNGKIDLSQAEAVCDVIKAKTESALSCAAQQLQGSLRIFVDEQKRKIVDLLATIEAGSIILRMI